MGERVEHRKQRERLRWKHKVALCVRSIQSHTSVGERKHMQ